jgi:hypothetical protein
LIKTNARSVSGGSEGFKKKLNAIDARRRDTSLETLKLRK